MRKRLGFLAVTVAALAVIGSATAFANGMLDFGVARDQHMAAMSSELFGVKKPIAESSTQSIDQATAAADPTKLVTLAKGLRAHVVTTQGPAVDDQITLWPNDTNTRRTSSSATRRERPDPGLVRIQLSTGTVSTIVTGTDELRPDPTHTVGHDPLR